MSNAAKTNSAWAVSKQQHFSQNHVSVVFCVCTCYVASLYLCQLHSGNNWYCPIAPQQGTECLAGCTQSSTSSLECSVLQDGHLLKDLGWSTFLQRVSIVQCKHCRKVEVLSTLQNKSVCFVLFCLTGYSKPCARQGRWKGQPIVTGDCYH